MNEGHSAFLALERIRLQIVEKKLDFYSALQVVASANVFTTHTPVPAGNDAFHGR
jgi:starch phosphorylase